MSLLIMADEKSNVADRRTYAVRRKGRGIVFVSSVNPPSPLPKLPVTPRLPSNRRAKN